MLGFRRIHSQESYPCGVKLAVGYIYIDGVTINDIYNGKRLSVIFFEIIGMYLLFGFGLLPPAPDKAMVEPDKKYHSRRTQDEYSDSPAPAHRESGFLLFSQD
jgi:hypothetical protein